MKNFDMRSLWITAFLSLTLPLATVAATVYTTHVTPTDPTEYSYTVAGGCGACVVTDAGFVADASLSNFGTVALPMGTGTSVRFRAKLSSDFTGAGYAGLLVENSAGLLTSLDLDDITVLTYYQGVRVDSFTTSANLTLIPGIGNQQYIEIAHSNTVDEIAVEFRGMASTAWDVDIYYGYASSTSIMPVELSAFQGVALPNHHIQLNWTTEQESNNRHFVIERSADGRMWEDLGLVAGAGHSSQATNYQYTDDAPLATANMYRLRQVDFNGTYTHSSVLSVNMAAVGDEVNVGPNPTVGMLNLMFRSAENSEYEVQVFDARGALVRTETVATGGATFSRQLDLADFPAGVYVVRVGRPGWAVTEKVLVTR